MKTYVQKIVVLLLISLGTVSQAQELVIPSTFKYQTINNQGVFSETTYADANLSRFYGYSEYTIKLYSDYNATVNSQAPHVGILVKLDNKAVTLFQIENSYIGHNVKVAVYDRSNRLLGVSVDRNVTGNEILNAPLAIKTFANVGYRFVYE